MKNNSDNWFLLYCKSKDEQRAVDNLENQDIESFFVSMCIEKVIRKKKIMKEVPLFPNYVFVKLCTATNNFNSVRSTRGVIDFVKFGIEYIKVPIELINNLKCYNDYKIEPEFKHGDNLFIDAGPLKGLNAIYEGPDGLERSMLLVKLLQQQNQVSVSNVDIKVTNKNMSVM